MCIILSYLNILHKLEFKHKSPCIYDAHTQNVFNNSSNDAWILWNVKFQYKI